MRKKKKPERTYATFDTSVKYIMPMLPVEVGTRRTYENEVKDVVVSIYQEPKTGDVRASADGYQDKWFYAMFFEWLLYTKYVKKAENIL